MVAAKADAQVEDHQLARLNLSIARRAAARAAAKILAEVGQRLAERVHGDGVQLGIEIQLIDARPHDLPRVLVHGPIGFVRPREHSQFVGILAPSQLEHDRIDFHERHIPAQQQLRRKRLEFAGHLLRRRSEFRLQHGRAGRPLFVARRRMPFGLVAEQLVRAAGGFELPIGQHERDVAVARSSPRSAQTARERRHRSAIAPIRAA